MKTQGFEQKRWAGLRLRCTPILLQHTTTDPSTWQPGFFPFTDADQTDFRCAPSYQLEASHVRMLAVLASCREGICGLQGPPETGKTTLVAKIAAMTMQQCQLNINGSGRIALTAHSNKAVEALMEKLLDLLPKMFAIPATDILWVETDSRRARRRESDESTPSRLEALSVETRRQALAGAEPARFATYLAHSTEPEKWDEKKAWWTERKVLDTKLRASCKFFVSTISCLSSSFWKLDPTMMGERTSIDMLIVDEASQTTWAHIFEGWVVVDPKVIFLAGDDKQLGPYAISQSGREVLERSPLELTKERLPESFRSAGRGISYAMESIQANIPDVLRRTCFHRPVHRG